MSAYRHVGRRVRIARAIVAIAAGAMLVAACDSESNTPTALEPQFARSEAQVVNRMLAEARAGTARFHDIDVAVAEGYAPMGGCVSVPGVGGMGIHLGRMDLIMDAGFEAGRPEVLLYEPQADGGMKLVAVEYLVVAAAWHGAGNADIPSFGGVPFEDGPAPGTYALHAWIWKNNPKGTFVGFNPNVQCSGGDEGHAH